MACSNCKKCNWGSIKHTCRVCELTRNDSSQKFVCHCDLCGVYLCQEHHSWSNERVIAIVKDVKAKVIASVKETAKKIRKRFLTEDFDENDATTANPRNIS